MTPSTPNPAWRRYLRFWRTNIAGDVEEWMDRQRLGSVQNLSKVPGAAQRPNILRGNAFLVDRKRPFQPENCGLFDRRRLRFCQAAGGGLQARQLRP